MLNFILNIDKSPSTHSDKQEDLLNTRCFVI